MSYQIEKDIPLPKRTGRPKKYPINIEELQVGEMIKVPMAEDNYYEDALLIRNFVSAYKNKSKRKFATRRITEDEYDVNGIGIWRLE